MTIQQVLDQVDRRKANMLSREDKIAYLNEIENQIHRELILTHEHTEAQETAPDYDDDTDAGTVLLAPVPYDKLYVFYIMSQIDQDYQEADKFNNDRAQFETYYTEYSDWYTRTHMPLQAGREFYA